jgi:DNA-binding response OmpR family regulator
VLLAVKYFRKGNVSVVDAEIILTTVTDRAQLDQLSADLGKDGYEVVSAPSLSELIAKIKKENKISLAVVDVPSFDQTVWEGLDELNQTGVPFIIISPGRSPSIQENSLKRGARGLFTRGIQFKDLLEHIHTLLGK